MADRPSVQTVVGRADRAALIFALVSQRLAIFYEHGQWLTSAQGTALIADWLSRSRRSLPLAERQHLSLLSDELARQTADSVSREAGMFISQELGEALDSRYQSDIGAAIMAECERLLDRHQEA